MAREIAGVFVRLDHIADAEDVDVVLEAASEGAGDAFAAEFAAGVGVHWVNVVGVFIQWVGMVGEVFVATLREADAIDGFGGGDDDFLDAEFRGCFDDVVCGHSVDAKGLIIWDDHVAGTGCEVDYCIRGTWMLWKGEFGHVEKGGKGIKSLTAI